MQIKLQKDEYIQERLCKLKCSQGCQSPANYIVFEMGLLCTLCLSKLGEVPQDHLASLEQLAKIVADMAETYEKNNKNGTNLLPLKAEIEQQNKLIKALRDNLTLDVKTIHSKTTQQITQAHSHCLQQSRNLPLQNFFEPDYTASMLVNQTELFLANLNNLKVVQENGAISYVFKEPQKDPQESKDKALMQINSISTLLTESHQKVRDIMARFRESTKKQ